MFRRIRFDVRLLQRVPYEGVSRMSTSLRRRHRDRVVRRGIGLTIESDVRSRPRPPFMSVCILLTLLSVRTVLRHRGRPRSLCGEHNSQY